MCNFVRRIPVNTIGLLICIWLFLAIFNAVLLKAGFPLGTTYWFPINVFSEPTIHLNGIPYLFFFLIVLTIAYRFSPRFNIYYIWLVSIFLIILGNLGQGDWDSAFLKPFYEGGIQYYHDAIKISSWTQWLASFNAYQHTFLTHTQTHPPFAVLGHYLLLQASGNSLTFLSVMFVLISSLSVVFVWHIFKTLGVPLEERNLICILFSVIPAVNVYSAVSLDGVILTSATLFLLGLVVILKSEHISILGLLLMLLGLVITNLLTFVGVFLIAVAGIQALKELILYRRFNMIISLTISISFFIAIIVVMLLVYGYNHIQSFLIESARHNPDGFRLLSGPLNYLATRVVDICEIALFLSFGFLSMLFHPDRLGFSWSDWRDMNVGIMLSGLITLLAIFLSGAYNSGETARGALFIYPYIMLTLANANSRILRDILILAGIQTFAMQLLGGYFW